MELRWRELSLEVIGHNVMIEFGVNNITTQTTSV
jgi:hypothetical protein